VRRRAITALALAAALAGLAVALLAVPRGLEASTRPRSAARPTRKPLLRVGGVLPSWRAPGATVTVAGWAGRSERLRLQTASGRTLARTISGPRGHYSLRFPAPAPGRYRLRVVARGHSVAAGSLLVRPLMLAAVGDVTFGEQVGPSVAAHGSAYPWTGVARTLHAADVTVGNLETSISTRGVASAKQYTFRGPPESLPAMAQRAGFDVLTLANNHTMDYGPEALLDTLRLVRAAGIRPIGAGANALAARRPAVVEAGGLKVAFLGYSDVNPLGFPATQWTPGTARADAAAIASDVRAAGRRADVVVCFFHWGVELHPDPDSRQKQLAAACLDAGAQVVLGAHPHVFGPVTQPGARRLVAWTLGNFVFPSTGESARTAILEVRLDRAGVRGYRLLPVRIDGFRPQLVEPGSASG